MQKELEEIDLLRVQIERCETRLMQLIDQERYDTLLPSQFRSNQEEQRSLTFRLKDLKHTKLALEI